jgi:hypothetical protein
MLPIQQNPLLLPMLTHPMRLLVAFQISFHATYLRGNDAVTLYNLLTNDRPACPAQRAALYRIRDRLATDRRQFIRKHPLRFSKFQIGCPALVAHKLNALDNFVSFSIYRIVLSFVDHYLYGQFLTFDFKQFDRLKST